MHLGRNDPRHQYRLGAPSKEEGLWVLVDKLNMKTCGKKRLTVSWVMLGKVLRQVKAQTETQQVPAETKQNIFYCEGDLTVIERLWNLSCWRSSKVI